MKKIFTAMIVAGIILAMVTAGGADAESISFERLFLQSAIASLLMLSGSFFVLRGEKA